MIKRLLINPNDADAWSNRGYAFDSLGRYTEAVDSYDKALAIDPDNAGAKQNREIALKKIT